MRKILIFEPFLSGHRLEYIHHLHEGASKSPESQYYFAISNDYKRLKRNYKWSESANITFLFLDQQEIQLLQHRHKIQRISRFIKIASNLSRQYEINEVFFISLGEYLPWLPLFFRSKAAISGIIYYIYLYDWKSKGFITRMRNAFTLLSVIPLRNYKKIFLLNDPIAAVYMNKKFKTKKFHYLPDPYLPLNQHREEEIESVRKKLLLQGKKVFLHFGSMSSRKGTLNILRAISLLAKEIADDCCFIFAGKVNNDIKETFYILTNELKTQAQILVFDEFCTPDFLSSLCEISNVILAPYYNTAYSSGIIGYAANYHKPIVVPDEKLIAKLVRRYHLGYMLKDNTPESISQFIRDSHTFISIDGKHYIDTHTVDNFVKKTLLFE